MRFFSIAAALLTITLSLLFLNRLTITEKILTTTLQALGGQEIQLSVTGLSGKQLTLSSLATTFTDNSAAEKIQLQNLVVRFSMGELFKGRLTELTIEHLELYLGQQEKKSKKDPSHRTIQKLFAPHSLPPFLPDRINIRELRLFGPGTAILAGKPLQLTGRLQGPSPSATLELLEDDIKIEAALEQLEKQNGRLQIEAYREKSRFFHLSLYHSHGKVTGELHSQLNGISNLSPRLPTPLPHVSGELSLTFATDDSKEMPLLLKIDVQGQDISLPGGDLSSLQASLLMRINSPLSFTFQRGSHLEVTDLRTGKLTIPRLKIVPEQESTLSLSTNAGPLKIRVDLQELRFQDLIVRPGSIHMDFQAPPSPFHLLLHSKEMTLQYRQIRIPLQTITAELEKQGHDLHLTAALSHALIPGRIEGRANHNLKEGDGSALISTVQPFDLHGEGNDLRQLARGVDLPFTLSNGLLDTSITMAWRKGAADFLKAMIAIHDGIGEYGNMVFSGLTIKQDIQLFPRIETLNPGHVSMDKLDSGIKITNIVLGNRLIPGAKSSPPAILLDTMEGELLGGRISSEKILLNPARPDMNFVVRLRGIVLEELMKLMQVGGLTVTGLMDADIPVQIQGRQIRVADGELKSREPGGTIRYLPPGGRESIPYLPEYVMQALEEFHYHTLSATPVYDPDGNLTLNFHIQGISPKLDTTRPVHLNLNSQQNLLSLLQSLRYTKSLTDDLEKQIEAGPPTQ